VLVSSRLADEFSSNTGFDSLLPRRRVHIGRACTFLYEGAWFAPVGLCGAGHSKVFK
jgi:hypothetical protein